jgi:hypothetical protein
VVVRDEPPPRDCVNAFSINPEDVLPTAQRFQSSLAGKSDLTRCEVHDVSKRPPHIERRAHLGSKREICTARMLNKRCEVEKSAAYFQFIFGLVASELLPISAADGEEGFRHRPCAAPAVDALGPINWVHPQGIGQNVQSRPRGMEQHGGLQPWVRLCP